MTSKKVCTLILGAIFVKSEEHTAILQKFRHILSKFLYFNLIYLFVSRHEVHSMNTHTLQNAG